MAGSRVLITGGSGFVGSHIADALMDANVAEIITIDNLVRGRREHLRAAEARGQVTFIEGDIRDRDLLQRSMQGIDYVFHEAALRITHCAADPRLGHSVMVEGTFNVVEAAHQAGVKKVVAASSASVYGEPSSLPMHEEHPYNNRTLYGAAKIANEHLLRSFNDMYGLPYVALRYFNVYGPRMDAFGQYVEVMIRWMTSIGRGEPPRIYGDGTQTMDFIYVGDVARANIAALRSDASDVALNVASGTQTSLTELSGLLCETMGRPDLRPEYTEERKVNPVHHRLGATEQARERIGFSATVDLREGLRRLVAWWQADAGATIGVGASTGADATTEVGR
ncbi:MAG: NAD-dependent epimerase/dehydratase family protein [Ktedonobacterales bacterium]|nr:NAD-dependent epimerase/dehydratase family protein [Ktedonobacterales bacterium]